MPRSVHARSYSEKPIWNTRKRSGKRAILPGMSAKKRRIERVGEFVAGQGRPGQHLPFHVADVPVDAAVPDHAEDVLHAVVAQVGEEADVAAEFQQVVLQRAFEIVAAVVPLELLLGLLGEAHRPGHVGRPLAFQNQADDVAFLHGWKRLVFAGGGTRQGAQPTGKSPASPPMVTSWPATFKLWPMPRGHCRGNLLRFRLQSIAIPCSCCQRQPMEEITPSAHQRRLRGILCRGDRPRRLPLRLRHGRDQRRQYVPAAAIPTWTRNGDALLHRPGHGRRHHRLHSRGDVGRLYQRPVRPPPRAVLLRRAVRGLRRALGRSPTFAQFIAARCSAASPSASPR